MFRYSEDRIPVILILSLSLVDFCVYFFVDNTWALVIYWLITLNPRAKICAWNHHHQHTLTFKSKYLNRVLEFFYALHTGVTTNLWLLHHVLGHHHNFLNQTQDESRWKRKSGKAMGVIEYTLSVALTAYPRGYHVGEKYPKAKKTFIFYSALTFAILFMLVLYKPISATFLFILPMICGLTLTAMATYYHHANHSTENEFEASMNNINPYFNKITGNLGYHTAHHYKQGVHWSKLPELHEKIKHKIPEKLIKNSRI